jgi:Ca-activated chloride channel homolog
MLRRRIRYGFISLLLVHVAVIAIAHYGMRGSVRAGKADRPSLPGGELRLIGADGKPSGACPLQHTDVAADISGYVGRVHVRQTFRNPLDRKIEAVYTFPLPQDSAVDEMVMTVGAGRIVGKIKERQEARRVYETAKRAGHVAGLLAQERPNIFTQSVANIEPGAEVVIEISYVETLKYEEGIFEFVFPTVVGPRYMPGSSTGTDGTGSSPDTTRVPDASRISPPVVPPETRAGHDISLTVSIEGGTELFDVLSTSHPVEVQQPARGRATVILKEQATLPNKDFILQYRTATDKIGDAFLVHSDARGTFFSLVLQPPQRVSPKEARPKEMIFVIDRSGSMEGFPIEKAKAAMRLCIEQMNPDDTFNLLSFSGGTGQCFEKPVPNTPANRKTALGYLSDLHGSGGTEMMPAVQAALAGKEDPERVRVVCFMTDGYVGNDFEIIDTVKKSAGTARVFSFGIGNSVNRFLLDEMAHAGRGEVEYVTLEKQGDAAAQRFHERIHSPVLTDIGIDWGGLQVTEVYPEAPPDLFSTKPLMIHGRLTGPAEGTITLRGKTAARAFERKVRVTPPAEPGTHGVGGRHDALASLWARAKIKALMMRDMAGLQSGTFAGATKDLITALGLEYRLMTQFTSFVAVEERVVTRGGDSATVPVPVELPEGVSRSMASGASGTLVASTGDPLLTVEAPPNAEHVVALMPGGDVKRLRFNPGSQRWEVRFDIPTYAREGDYVVRVVIVRKDGTRRLVTVRYGVDLSPPRGTGHAALVPANVPVLRLELEASEDTARVVALLPWGDKAVLRPAELQGAHWSTLVPVPPGEEGTPHRVTFVLTDRAHNRTTIQVEP